MKRLFVSFVVVVASCVNVFAKSDLQLISGSLSELKGSKAKVCATWDYSNSTIEKQEIKAFLKEKGSEWERDYEIEIKRAEDNFLSRINDKTNDIQAIVDKKGIEQPVAVLDVDGVPGGGYGNEKRRVEAYRELAELLAKLIKKSK